MTWLLHTLIPSGILRVPRSAPVAEVSRGHCSSCDALENRLGAFADFEQYRRVLGRVMATTATTTAAICATRLPAITASRASIAARNAPRFGSVSIHMIPGS